MPEIEIKNSENKVVEKMELSEEAFGKSGYEGLLHQAVLGYLANRRQGTHATKTKGLVSGGGRKPYRQKKTGRARAGSIRSPLWKGGGTTFGPQPRDYSMALPRRAKKTALFAALTKKLTDGEIVALEDIKMEKPGTKKMLSILKGMGIEGGSVLLVLPERDDAVMLSTRNIPAMSVTLASDLNAHDVVSFRRLLLTRRALKAIEERAL